MAEYKLSYTAAEIDNKLGKIDELSIKVEQANDSVLIGSGYMPEGCKIKIDPSVNSEENHFVNVVRTLSDAEKEAIVQDVINALGTPIFGTVDEDKNIVLSGELAAGTYTIKYENSDGSSTTIGTVTVE